MQEKFNEEMLDPEKTRLFSSHPKEVLSKKDLKKADKLAQKEIKAQKKLDKIEKKALAQEEKVLAKEEKRQAKLAKAQGKDKLIFRLLSKFTIFLLFFLPIAYLILLACQHFNLFNLGSSLQAEYLFSICLYNMILAFLFVRPKLFKYIMTITYLIFFILLLVVFHPYMSASPFIILAKIVYPPLPLSIFP